MGGTKTAVLVSRDGEDAGRAEGPGAAVRPGRALNSAATITEVVRRALTALGVSEAAALVVGAAGAGRDPERSELRAALASERLAATVRVVTDIEIALAAAFDRAPGIVISAGTGSIAVGRDAAGALHRVSGYGWQMGDEGSGYAIGRAALGAVGRAADRRSPDTALSERLRRATGSPDFDALVRWAASAGPAEVASLASHVLDVAAGGDTVARGIADYAARELSQLAIQLLERIDAPPPLPVALTGGLLGRGMLREEVIARLSEVPELEPVSLTVDPARGAVRLAELVLA